MEIEFIQEEILCHTPTLCKFTGFIWFGKSTKRNGKTLDFVPKNTALGLWVRERYCTKISNLILIHLISGPKVFLMQK